MEAISVENNTEMYHPIHVRNKLSNNRIAGVHDVTTCVQEGMTIT